MYACFRLMLLIFASNFSLIYSQVNEFQKTFSAINLLILFYEDEIEVAKSSTDGSSKSTLTALVIIGIVLAIFLFGYLIHLRLKIEEKDGNTSSESIANNVAIVEPKNVDSNYESPNLESIRGTHAKLSTSNHPYGTLTDYDDHDRFESAVDLHAFRITVHKPEDSTREFAPFSVFNSTMET